MKVKGVREGGVLFVCGYEGTQNGENMHRHLFKLPL